MKETLPKSWSCGARIAVIPKPDKDSGKHGEKRRGGEILDDFLMYTNTKILTKISAKLIQQHV